MWAGRYAFTAAGTLPAAWIDPVALRLMSEAGLSPGAEFPKPLTHEMVRASDIVVALGCGDACPILPGRRYYDWNVPDLKGLDIESARSVGAPWPFASSAWRSKWSAKQPMTGRVFVAGL